jgi:dTMP kinase
MNNKFITFEGVEGCGKSTQIELLANFLQSKNCATVTTREPGGTAISDHIREILLSPEHDNMDPITELLLYGAARRQHVVEFVQPNLAANKIVLCDRYVDSTRAYQGAARKIAPNILNQLLEIPTGGLMPKLTLVFDCPAKLGLERAHKRNLAEKREDRFDNEALEFHCAVQEGFLNLAAKEPERVKVIDASKDMQTVHLAVIETIKNLINF